MFSRLINNPCNDADIVTPLQLLSVPHNPSCDGCGRDAEEWKGNAKTEFGQQNVAKKRLGVI